MKIKLIIFCIFGLILVAGGGFAAVLSPFLTDSGQPEMIRAFYVALMCAIAIFVVGLVITIWSIVAMFT